MGSEKARLSRREMQVAELLAWGAAKKEIPDLLQKLYGGRLVSVRTVENVTRSIYDKLGIGKASELSAWYFCECHDVDAALNPLRKVKNTLIAILFMFIMTPQLVDSGSDVLRPQRARVERVIRVRRKN